MWPLAQARLVRDLPASRQARSAPGTDADAPDRGRAGRSVDRSCPARVLEGRGVAKFRSGLEADSDSMRTHARRRRGGRGPGWPLLSSAVGRGGFRRRSSRGARDTRGTDALHRSCLGRALRPLQDPGESGAESSDGLPHPLAERPGLPIRLQRGGDRRRRPWGVRPRARRRRSARRRRDQDGVPGGAPPPGPHQHADRGLGWHPARAGVRAGLWGRLWVAAATRVRAAVTLPPFGPGRGGCERGSLDRGALPGSGGGPGGLWLDGADDAWRSAEDEGGRGRAWRCGAEPGPTPRRAKCE